MNTRVAVPLSKEAYDAISLISEVSGVPRGRIIAEALEAAIPSFIAIADAYKAALAVEGEERAAILDAMTQAERRLMQAVDQLDLPLSSRPSSVPSGAAGEGAGDGREAPSDPPVTNRGVPGQSEGGQ